MTIVSGHLASQLANPTLPFELAELAIEKIFQKWVKCPKCKSKHPACLSGIVQCSCGEKFYATHGGEY